MKNLIESVALISAACALAVGGYYYQINQKEQACFSYEHQLRLKKTEREKNDIVYAYRSNCDGK